MTEDKLAEDAQDILDRLNRLLPLEVKGLQNADIDYAAKCGLWEARLDHETAVLSDTVARCHVSKTFSPSQEALHQTLVTEIIKENECLKKHHIPNYALLHDITKGCRYVVRWYA